MYEMYTVTKCTVPYLYTVFARTFVYRVRHKKTLVTARNLTYIDFKPQFTYIIIITGEQNVRLVDICSHNEYKIDVGCIDS